MIGNYYMMEAGENVDALRILTGAPVKQYLLRHFIYQTENTNENDFQVITNDTKSWELMRDAYHLKQPMTIETVTDVWGDHENECGII